ncbi:MAG: EamA family transporter [Myxococcota bacterium]
MAASVLAPRRVSLLLGYAAVYIVWGSTYLALRYVVEALPPLVAAGARFLVAGAILYAFMRLRGTPAPNRRQWLIALMLGAFLLLGGNGGVMWAEQRISSAIAALLVASEPLWIVLLEWLRPRGTRPSRRMVIGLAIGFAGVVILVSPSGGEGVARVDLAGAAAVVLGAFFWAVGSLLSNKLPAGELPKSPIATSASQMLAGGALLFIVGAARGELPLVTAEAFTPKVVFSIAYLIVFGSIVAFNTYAWLLRVEPPARVATYAFVNPAVAMLLGWAIGGEPITTMTLVAGAFIIVAVALIVTGSAKPGKPTETARELATAERAA